jgi:post-segregation antitoxin (ccd killing protein)
MARQKATITVDRDKLETAKALIGAGSISETIDVALSRLIRAEQLRRDVAAYAREPFTADELGFADLSVELDLGDDDVDYDKLYGKRR